MDGIYYVIKNKVTGEHAIQRGISHAPHLYSTEGKASGQLKSNHRYWNKDDYEVVKVILTEVKDDV